MIKPGSIVVVLPYINDNKLPFNILWEPVADGKTPYTIREIFESNGSAVLFEEGVIGWFFGEEVGIGIHKVREVLPPGEISEEILEQLKIVESELV